MDLDFYYDAKADTLMLVRSDDGHALAGEDRYSIDYTKFRSAVEEFAKDAKGNMGSAGFSKSLDCTKVGRGPNRVIGLEADATGEAVLIELIATTKSSAEVLDPGQIHAYDRKGLLRKLTALKKSPTKKSAFAKMFK